MANVRIYAKFKKFEDKKWSTRYQEVDEDDEIIEEDEWRAMKVGAFYLRKSTELGKNPPEFIEMEVRAFQAVVPKEGGGS